MDMICGAYFFKTKCILRTFFYTYPTAIALVIFYSRHIPAVGLN